jgi:PAS domain S-box-containing protein
MDLNVEQTLRDRRDIITNAWYQALLPLGTMLYFRDEALLKFGELTDAVIDFLTGKTDGSLAAHEIGVNLAKFHILHPGVIEITGELWSREISRSIPPDQISQFYPRLVMLYNLGAGYFEQARKTIMSEQEQIRYALVSTVEETNLKLEKYQHALEEMLDERNQQLQLKAKQYQQITETSLIGIFQIEPSGKLIFSNEAFAQMIGVTNAKLAGTSFRDLIPNETMAIASRLFQETLAGNRIHTEFRLLRKDGGELNVLLSAVRTEMPDRTILTGFVTDITERLKAENELRLSETRYRTLAENAQALIIIIDREDRVEYINSFAANYVNRRPEEIIGQPRSCLFHGDSNEKMKRSLQLAFQGITSRLTENQIDFPSGQIWLSTSLVPLLNSTGQVNSVIVVSTDITEIKNIQKKLEIAKEQLEKRVLERTASLEASQEQSRKLARQIVGAQEEERRRVSRELHDEAGHALVALKYELDSSFRESGMDSDKAMSHFESMMSAINKTMEHIRHLSHSLRPPTLDVAGINLSLEDHCQETSERTGLKIQYLGLEIPNLPDEIGICLFRILQESLTNVRKHAGATKVNVHLGYQDATIRLRIKDNGKGMPEKNNPDGIGLLGIQERVEILGGNLQLKSQPGKGTLMLVSIPWQNGSLDGSR